MIKVAIKHFIFETCIDIWFQEVFNNFVKPVSIIEQIRLDFNRLISSNIIHSFNDRIENDKIVFDVFMQPMKTIESINLTVFVQDLINKRND